MPAPLFRLLLLATLLVPAGTAAQGILVPMDESQADHLKAYGAVYWALDRGLTVDWLLNYRGGAFLAGSSAALEAELRVRNVSFTPLGPGERAAVEAQIEAPSANMTIVALERAPSIAVYAPDQTLPWDDAVLLALTYAEVPYEQIYDGEILDGRLEEFDWVHLHHEDFTGQYGKFFARYRNTAWYREQQQQAEASAEARGYPSVRALKLAVSQQIRQYVAEGGFLFAMCSGTDTLDLALAAHRTDVVPAPFDGTPAAPDAAEALDYSQTFAFEGFTPNLDAMQYEHSDLDVTTPPERRDPSVDYFTLFEFSAKWDPVPTMLTQSQTASVKGFMGQTTAFDPQFVKSGVVILAEAPTGAVRYLYGPVGRGFFAYYAGHDPEDYQHFVGDPPTDLALHRHSPGYRLILNNVLFPAAQRQPQRT